ncbi:MAG: hypothetical protein LBU06_10045, partial [Desulfovibrio sp.]|nr:hypothetical protein [Desulfovibrio sp.]
MKLHVEQCPGRRAASRALFALAHPRQYICFARQFKGKMAAVSGEKTITELGSEFGVHQTLIHK